MSLEGCEVYYRKPYISWRRRGDHSVPGKPIEHAGYYITYYCGSGCCRPHGPFRDKLRTLAWSIGVARTVRFTDTWSTAERRVRTAVYPQRRWLWHLQPRAPRCGPTTFVGWRLLDRMTAGRWR